ncbi:glycosyltransferase family 4 protein [Microlunatus flavus]|uniref:glycosyltransferase family 4 protein n=1 Tax=Microlunatus flavus TaxID=1036181 RepID=UPI000B839C4E|nr:glycosyltransferase family 4 protein [Microlunatus flavus]
MRVLVISHEASRSGAPRVAAMVSRDLVEAGHEVAVLSRLPGPLMADLGTAAPAAVEPLPRVRRRLRRTRGLRGVTFALDTAVAALELLRHRPGLVYVNSTAAAVYLRPARWLRLPRVLHVHESGAVASSFLRHEHAAAELERTTLVACSPSVRADLAVLTGRPPEAVVLLPSVPDDDLVARLADLDPDRPYAADDLVVGCCGSVEHRKGPDLWVQVARRVREALPQRAVRFVWLGDLAAPVPGADEAGAEFVGPTTNPYPHMRRFDVATLPSRDDPFPLVVLESMLLGTPVVAFDVGGVAQQVGDGGRVVPAEDVDAFAAAVTELLVDADERHRLGTAAARRVDGLYSSRVFAERLEELVVAPGR